MSSLVIGIIVFAALAVASFFSKRRYGTLGLAIVAGSVLSSVWSNDASYIVSSLGLATSNIQINALSAIAVTVLPAVVLMFKGKKYKSIASRVAGSVMLGLLGVCLMLPAIQSMSSPLGSQDVMYLLVQNKDLIIGLGISLAVVDLLLVRPAKPLKKSKH